MMNLTLSALETVINRYLNLDPDTVMRLQALRGKFVRVDISDWKISFIVTAIRNGIELIADNGEPTDSVIRGKLINLLRAGYEGASGKSLFENKIEIEGDTELGEKMRDILRDIDIDWEEHLSSLIGDTTAHAITWRAKKFAEFGKKFVTNISEHFKEFVHHEAQCFPTQQEVEQFYQNVAKTRDDVDRLEARVTLLKQ